jgi:hypothetical protein
VTEYGDIIFGRTRAKVGKNKIDIPENKATLVDLGQVVVELVRTGLPNESQTTVKIGRKSGRGPFRSELELRLDGAAGTREWTLSVAETHIMPTFSAEAAALRLKLSTLLPRQDRERLTAAVRTEPESGGWSSTFGFAAHDANLFRLVTTLAPGDVKEFRYRSNHARDDAAQDVIAEEGTDWKLDDAEAVTTRGAFVQFKMVRPKNR